MPPETLASGRRVHIIGGGPVGLMLTALLQTMGGFSIRLYEKRREYTRTRMVKLDSYLVADSVENYCIDYIDGENVEAVFDRTELDEGVAFRQSIPSGPEDASSPMDAGVLPAQRHRTFAQRPDRSRAGQIRWSASPRRSRPRRRWRCWCRTTF